MERARPALQTLVAAIENHPGSGQTRRLVRFLAGVYNGGDFPFDLTDLRALDTELANACIDYLNYDRLSKVEVHSHLPGGGRQMQQFIRQHRIRPQLHLSNRDAHEERLEALASRLNRDRDDLLKQALEDVLSPLRSQDLRQPLGHRALHGPRSTTHPCPCIERRHHQTSLRG